MLRCCLVPILIFASIVTVKADGKINRIDYHGWSECYRLNNGTVDLVFVPQIGRIMRFGYVGGPNFIWENSKLPGQTQDPDFPNKDWMNFGGDKLWPAPQDRWGWPPDPVIDAGQSEVKVLSNSHVRIIGRPSKKHGIRFIREISLDPKLPVVNIINIIENTSSKPQSWSIWEVCQVDRPEFAAIRESKSGRFKAGYYAFKGNEPARADISRDARQIRIRRNTKKGAKIGSDAQEGYAFACRDGTDFAVSIETTHGGRYPDNGCIEEIWTNADPDQYVELEVLSPIRTIKPGERFSVKTRWSLSHGEG
jgi:hypothetical protein